MRRLLIALLAVLVPAAAVAGWIVATEPQGRASEGWRLAAAMPGPRGEGATAVVERRGVERAVVAGGFVGVGRTSDRVEVYDPEADTWSRGPSLPAARHHPAAAGLGGDVYVSGGAATALADTGEADLWVWREGTQAWEALEPMPERRFGHRMVAADGRLFVIGGYGERTRLLVYEPGVGWSSAADLPQPRDHLGAVAVDGAIWVIGGRHGDRLLDRVDVYDVATDQWRAGPALPSGISSAAVGALGGTISVVGGERPDPVRGWVSSRHRRLDPAAERWEEGPPPVLGVHGAGDAVLGGRLFVFGGASRPGPWSVLSWSDLTQVYDGG